MNSRHILSARPIILAAAIVGFVYLHSRKAAPLQDASPDATTATAVFDNARAA